MGPPSPGKHEIQRNSSLPSKWNHSRLVLALVDIKTMFETGSDLVDMTKVMVLA